MICPVVQAMAEGGGERASLQETCRRHRRCCDFHVTQHSCHEEYLCVA